MSCNNSIMQSINSDQSRSTCTYVRACVRACVRVCVRSYLLVHLCFRCPEIVFCICTMDGWESEEKSPNSVLLLSSRKQIEGCFELPNTNIFFALRFPNILQVKYNFQWENRTFLIEDISFSCIVLGGVKLLQILNLIRSLSPSYSFCCEVEVVDLMSVSECCLGSLSLCLSVCLSLRLSICPRCMRMYVVPISISALSKSYSISHTRSRTIVNSI